MLQDRRSILSADPRRGDCFASLAMTVWVLRGQRAGQPTDPVKSTGLRGSDVCEAETDPDGHVDRLHCGRLEAAETCYEPGLVN